MLIEQAEIAGVPDLKLPALTQDEFGIPDVKVVK